MKLSKQLIEDMGFTEFPETDVIKVNFRILKVYSIRGMVFEKDCKVKRSFLKSIIWKILKPIEKNYKVKRSEVVSIADRCSIVIAQSINEASKILTGDVDVSVDDEGKWLSEKKVSPPFLLIYFKESASRELRGGYRRIEKDGNIITYDAFPEGKKEIRDWENDAVPGIVTSLTVSLSTLERQVDLIPVDREIFGVTKERQKLFDLKGTISAKVSVSSSKSIEEINSSLEKTKELLPVLTKDVCRNFYEALNEPDRMKKFIGYFQFIERYTHSTYKKLNYKKDIQNAFKVPERVNKSATNFFEKIFDDSKNLSQRFHWCSICAWGKIESNDVTSFLDIKEIRDKLSHGVHIDEKQLPVDKAKILALKLLGTNET